jgi:hypothetical protein
MDVDLVLEAKYGSAKSGDKAGLPEWSLKLPENGGNSGLDGSTFVVQVLAPGVE